MSHAKLVSISVERFKSYETETTFHLSPLTVLVGRNNSGKSTLIQALLLLKQTLAHGRSEVPLFLGEETSDVEAENLRELTHGWPAANGVVPGPGFELTWDSLVDLEAGHAAAGSPDIKNVEKLAKVHFHSFPESLTHPHLSSLRTKLSVSFYEAKGQISIDSIRLKSVDARPPDSLPYYLNGPTASIKRHASGEYRLHWGSVLAPDISVEFDHFIPYLQIDRSKLGPRDKQRAFYAAFTMLFAQPLEDLKRLLRDFAFLGSGRDTPRSLYRAATVPPDSVGVAGEHAAQLLHSRQREFVHYLPPLALDDQGVRAPGVVHARPFADAVNDVFAGIGVPTPVHVKDVTDSRFQLLFGRASVQHVGRGLIYLLPIIELGLIADPLRGHATADTLPLDEYNARLTHYAHFAHEELEAHTHPKVQSRLAHWLVALAMSGRRLIVETHSDHLVRRLRGLVARAEPNSPLERWLLDNVTILEIEQKDGRSLAQPSRLTREGGFAEHWPADFMDEASHEESSIYAASLDKAPTDESPAPPLDIAHDEGPEPEEPA